MKTCDNFTKTWRALFPPRPEIKGCATGERNDDWNVEGQPWVCQREGIVETYEINRGRTEGRCLIAFDTSATAVAFPFVAQAARLTRCIDSDKKPATSIDTEYLLTSRTQAQMNVRQMYHADRGYWGIETAFHLRLDVIGREDASRVRHRTSALNLGMMRRAVTSLAIHWIRKCSKPRQATMSGFFDFMSANQAKKAFSLVTVCRSSWLPKP
jgi:predicted transposase YbfD/YdcC